jgi:ankyrin repeat protein
MKSREELNQELILVLSKAAPENMDKLVSYCINAGAEANANDAFGNSALGIAISKKVEAITLYSLLKAGANPNVGDAYNSPLIMLANYEDFNQSSLFATMLLQYGAQYKWEWGA